MDGWTASPIHLDDNLGQVINVTINQPLVCFLVSHEGVVYINVTLKVKTVVMFLVWVTSIAVQPETSANDCNDITKAYS